MNFTPLFPQDIMSSRPVVIAGPCSAESESQVVETARQLHDFGVRIFRAGAWKPRTRPGGFEGVGVEALPWIVKAAHDLGMLAATEVANQTHVREVVDAGIDVLWIGARTSANPFAMQEIADTLAMYPQEKRDSLAVLVKNPVNPDLELWIGAIARINGAGVTRIGAIHRGFSSYGKHIYRNPPKWRIPIEFRRRLPEVPLFCDPSHIGGKRELVAPISQHALDMGYDGLIIESHCDPDCALSDAAQQVTPETLHAILSSLDDRSSQLTTESLKSLRQKIDRVDDELLELLARRMRISREIGQYKLEHDMPVVQQLRYADLMQRRVQIGETLDLDPDFTRNILSVIHEESVRQQVELKSKP